MSGFLFTGAVEWMPFELVYIVYINPEFMPYPYQLPRFRRLLFPPKVIIMKFFSVVVVFFIVLIMVLLQVFGGVAVSDSVFGGNICERGDFFYVGIIVWYVRSITLWQHFSEVRVLVFHRSGADQLFFRGDYGRVHVRALRGSWR